MDGILRGTDVRCGGQKGVQGDDGGSRPTRQIAARYHRSGDGPARKETTPIRRAVITTLTRSYSIARSDGLTLFLNPSSLKGRGLYSPTRSTFVLAGILSSLPTVQYTALTSSRRSPSLARS